MSADRVAERSEGGSEDLAGVTPFTSEMNEIQGFKLVLQKKLGLFADYKPNRVEFPTSQEISLVKKA